VKKCFVDQRNIFSFIIIMSGNNLPRSFRERLALISGVDLEQLDGLETEERADLLEFEPNLARLVIFAIKINVYLHC
jgi:hypothetical protein